ncbi:unnamed protein product [Lupinus luteus]|uniref:Uncharacterized protein n=1 Tax=Lupinus luteus TaxID=3873 RepID=A0AAV1WF87_LUPLU
MTLEQKWEEIYYCENEMKGNNTVNVDAVVQREKVVVAGWEAMIDELEVAEGVLWFNSFSNVGEKNSVGLSSAIVERMKWEQERVGWIEGKEQQIRVMKFEVFEGTKEWKKFLYVLVETFVLKRLDVTKRVSRVICFAQDVKPRPLDLSDEYQQVEIIKRSHGFHAKSVAADGIPPEFLRRKGWKIDANTNYDYHLDAASGLNESLRTQLPDFNFPLSNNQSESVIVGKWYCPFMFVKEGMRLKDQMKKSVFYKLTLEQRWEKVFSKENSSSGEVAFFVDVVIETDVAKVAGSDAVCDENDVQERVVWFKSFDEKGAEKSVGLSLEIVERMKWEQERVGWIGGNDKQVRLERVEEFGTPTKLDADGSDYFSKNVAIIYALHPNYNNELRVLGDEDITVITALARDKETDDTE